MSNINDTISDEHIKKFARYQLVFDSVIQGLIDKDVSLVQEQFAMMISEFCSEPQETAMFLMWIMALHSVTYQTLCRMMNVQVSDDTMERGLFSMAVMDDPSQFPKETPFDESQS